MDLPFELFVALRYLLAGRKQALISAISLVSTLGVTVGVMALLIALALMTGLQAELRDRIVGSSAHVYVFKPGAGLKDYPEDLPKIKQVPRVLGAAPVIIGQGMITSATREGFISVKGIVPALEPEVTNIGAAMKSGSLADLEPREGEPDGIIIGEALAEKLGVKIGQDVRLITPQLDISPFGAIPRPRRLRVVGTFALGLFEFDESYGFVHLTVAGRILDRTATAYIEARVDDLFAAPEIARAVTDRLGPDYAAQDWRDINQSLFRALWLEKMAISIAIGLIVMVAALNIVASLVLLVMEKSRDIAILKTMGSSAGSIRRIFVLQGLVIGLAGTAMGSIAGCSLIYILDKYKLIRVPSDVYQISYVPFTLQPLDFVIVVISAIVICFVATIYPSRQAAKLDPAQALRYQ